MKEIDDAFGNWLAGFTDGEAHFGIHKHNYDNPRANYGCRFAIHLRDDDRSILEEIQRRLGIGVIYDKPVNTNDSSNRQPQTEFLVSAIAECVELVTLFETYPLRAKKQRDFDIWKTAVAELQKPIDCRNADQLEYLYCEIKERRKYEGRTELTMPKKIELQLSIEFEDTVEEEGDRARRRVEGIVKNNKSAEKQQ